MKIAVCIPTFNRGATIKYAIDSLVMQSDPPFDIHVFDNASTDDTSNIVLNYKNRLHFHPSEENVGYVGNINKCLALCEEYDWIGILHSDDVHFENSIKNALRGINKHPDAGMVFSRVHLLNENGDIYQKAQGEDKLYSCGAEAVLRCQGHVPCSATFYNSFAIKSVGRYDVSFPYSADEEYNARIGGQFDIVESADIFAGYRRHTGHLMIKTWMEKDFIPSFERMRFKMAEYAGLHSDNARKKIRSKLAGMFLNCGFELCACRRQKAALPFFWYAVRNRPVILTKPRKLVRILFAMVPLLGWLLEKAYMQSKRKPE
jgi:glycosyltransferase involved in cell wall biosynthesis